MLAHHAPYAVQGNRSAQGYLADDGLIRAGGGAQVHKIAALDDMGKAVLGGRLHVGLAAAGCGWGRDAHAQEPSVRVVVEANAGFVGGEDGGNDRAYFSLKII